MWKTRLCLERRKLSAGRKACSSSASPSLHSTKVFAQPRLRQASVAVKFVTNTTKECKRALVERLQSLHFNVQVETLNINQQAALLLHRYFDRRCFFSWSDLPDICRDSAGVRDLHVSECCQELAGAERPPAAAAAGGERAGRLQRWVPASPPPDGAR